MSADPPTSADMASKQYPLTCDDTVSANSQNSFDLECLHDSATPSGTLRGLTCENPRMLPRKRPAKHWTQSSLSICWTLSVP